MTKRSLLLISIALILSSVKAQGEEWVLIPQEKVKNAELLVDSQSIRQLPDGIVSALIRYEYKKSFSGERDYDCMKCNPVERVSHTIISTEFDCKSRKLRVRELTEYYEDMTPHTEYGSEAWKQPSPKGIDQVLVEYVCNYREK